MGAFKCLTLNFGTNTVGSTESPAFQHDHMEPGSLKEHVSSGAFFASSSMSAWKVHFVSDSSYLLAKRPACY